MVSCPSLDPRLLAETCRKIALEHFVKSSCIETSFLFERTAAHLGLTAGRLVCQVTAYSPKLAAQIRANAAVDETSFNTPGVWSVGLGIPQHPEDFVGRLDNGNNRFVGHVVNLVDGHLLDASADQMSRPEHDMPIRNPVLLKLAGPVEPKAVAYTETPAGVVLRYILHPDVPVPAVKRNKVIERLALGVARALLG